MIIKKKTANIKNFNKVKIFKVTFIKFLKLIKINI